MRVLIILAVATLTAAAPHLPSTSNGIIEDGEVIKIEKALGERRFIRSTDDSESTTDDVNAGVSEANDLSKEIAEEEHWAAEEKKWQEQAKADTESSIQDGEAASRGDATSDNSELEDSELSEESLWLADEKKWHEEENEGTEATELEGESSHEQEESSSETEDLIGSIIPAVLVEDVDLNNANAETLFPQLSLYPNNLMPWDIPGAYSRRWLYELPHYYRVPRVSKH